MVCNGEREKASRFFSRSPSVHARTAVLGLRPSVFGLRPPEAPAYLHATGPYGPASPSFTSKDTEGPSVLQTPDWSYVYYDEYTRGRYGAVRTKDFEHFEPFTDSLHAPRTRHGSAFLAPQSVLRGLQALDSASRPN